MGGGTGPFLVQPISQVGAAIRENGPLVQCVECLGGGYDCFKQGHGYLWISSKYVVPGIPTQVFAKTTTCSARILFAKFDSAEFTNGI